MASPAPQIDSYLDAERVALERAVAEARANRDGDVPHTIVRDHIQAEIERLRRKITPE